MSKVCIRTFALMLLSIVNAFAEEASGLSPNIMNPDAIVAGRDYEAIDPPVPPAIRTGLEVVEAFSFACPHCSEFEPTMEKWAASLPKDVHLRRLPVVFGRESWGLLARAYYAAEILGIADKSAGPVFAAIHKEQKRFNDDKSLAAFFAGQGVPEEKFLTTMKSHEVTERVKAGEALAAKYKITGVPTMVIQGKYQTSATMAGDYNNMLRIVEHLLQQERGARP